MPCFEVNVGNHIKKGKLTLSCSMSLIHSFFICSWRSLLICEWSKGSDLEKKSEKDLQKFEGPRIKGFSLIDKYQSFKITLPLALVYFNLYLLFLFVQMVEALGVQFHLGKLFHPD